MGSPRTRALEPQKRRNRPDRYEPGPGCVGLRAKGGGGRSGAGRGTDADRARARRGGAPDAGRPRGARVRAATRSERGRPHRARAPCPASHRHRFDPREPLERRARPTSAGSRSQRRSRRTARRPRPQGQRSLDRLAPGSGCSQPPEFARTPLLERRWPGIRSPLDTVLPAPLRSSAGLDSSVRQQENAPRSDGPTTQSHASSSTHRPAGTGACPQLRKRTKCAAARSTSRQSMSPSRWS